MRAAVAPSVSKDKKPATVVVELSARERIYYPIYDEYFTGDEVTVDQDYATTVETWNVAYINDRRTTPLGDEYRVLWVHPDASCRHLYLRTWEPRAKLAEGDFEEEMALVDSWKSSIETFEEFWRQDQVGMGLLGLDAQGLCLFSALKRAAELPGRPDIVLQQDIDLFVQDELVVFQARLDAGDHLKDFHAVLRRLCDAGRDFVYNAMVKTNYAVPGRRGARMLEEIELADGIYVVAAYWSCIRSYSSRQEAAHLRFGRRQADFVCEALD
ncbi:unnamed protein product [Phytophthora lilii]|uniref:Unnamed protein product n=1 Tax=Phytophthora lilii TaxID=2077276 RepID=A0A9W6TQP7_9STRA|nr:unnamed protein product [Phytophthora lilii]